MMRLLVSIGTTALMVAVGLLPATAAAQSDDANAMPHGEFAILLLAAVPGFTEPISDPEAALDIVKQLELVPTDWKAADGLTHGELADVLQRFGVIYVPTDRDAPASTPYVEALLRRELSKLRDYLANRLGHGFSVSHVMDRGVDRAVSPSVFD